jgi:ribosomal-protein-alanine N-acetyltransferase
MVIVTDRLTLREIDRGDFEAILAYQSNSLYMRYYPCTWADRTPDEMRKFLQRFLDLRKEQPRTKFQLAITIRDDVRLIGIVGVRMSSANATEGEIGCELAPRCWNLGYATEANRAVMQFSFEELGLQRLSASTVALNLGARRVLEKLGMRREGELRETTLLADGWANSVVYGILEQEWRDATASQPSAR